MTVMERERVRRRRRMNYNEIRISCLVKSMGKGKRVVSAKDRNSTLFDSYHFADIISIACIKLFIRLKTKPNILFILYFKSSV